MVRAMRRSLLSVVLLLVGLSIPAIAVAQGGTTSTISGIALDNTGGVVPGANINIKHNATGVVQEAITNSDGTFSVPGLPPGAYTVTVSLQGFKTVVVNNVTLTSGQPAQVKATLEVGGLSEQVVVTSSSEIVQTNSPTVSSTVTSTQITKLPLTSRSA